MKVQKKLTYEISGVGTKKEILIALRHAIREIRLAKSISGLGISGIAINFNMAELKDEQNGN